MLEKLHQSRERERKYEAMLKAGMQLFASKMGLNLNSLSDQIPAQPQRAPLLMIEEGKMENAQVPKANDKEF